MKTDGYSNYYFQLINVIYGPKSYVYCNNLFINLLFAGSYVYSLALLTGPLCIAALQVSVYSLHICRGKRVCVCVCIVKGLSTLM